MLGVLLVAGGFELIDVRLLIGVAVFCLLLLAFALGCVMLLICADCGHLFFVLFIGASFV